MENKYFATRCNLQNAADLESKEFGTKVAAIKWVKRCAFGKVRIQNETRQTLFSKGF